MGWAIGASGPRSAARGAANALPATTTASAAASTAHASARTAHARARAARSGLLDLDLTGDDGQLRGRPLERLPGVRGAVRVGGDDLVRERAAGIARRNGPDGRPEKVGGGARRRRRVRAVGRRELLAIGQLDDHALEALAVERLAGLVEHADAPDDFFQALVLAGEHAEGAGRPRLGPADQVALEEELARGLRVRGRGRSEADDRQRESSHHAERSHALPPSSPDVGSRPCDTTHPRVHARSCTWTSWMRTSRFCSPRAIVSVTVAPMPAASNTSRTSSSDRTGLPSTARMRSPSTSRRPRVICTPESPARAAGPLGTISASATPWMPSWRL